MVCDVLELSLVGDDDHLFVVHIVQDVPHLVELLPAERVGRLIQDEQVALQCIRHLFDDGVEGKTVGEGDTGFLPPPR